MSLRYKIFRYAYVHRRRLERAGLGALGLNKRKWLWNHRPGRTKRKGKLIKRRKRR